MNMPRFAIANRATTLAAMALLVVWGTMVFTTISRREDPEIVIRAAMLATPWPGASAEKVEQLVTRPLETAVKELPEVEKIISDSRVGLSAIIIHLHDDVFDIDVVWGKVRAKIRRVEPELPEGCHTPDLNTDFGEVAAMVLAMYQVPLPGKDRIERPYTMREMDDMLKDLEDMIQEIPMVGRIEKFGLQREVIYIEADARDWGQLAVKARTLAEVLDSRNTVAPGGTISGANIDYAVKPSGEFLTPEQIETVVVASKHGAPIHLHDLNLTVSRRYAEPRQKYTRFCSPEYPANGRRCDCLVLSFAMRKGYNVVELGNIVRRKVDELKASVLPPDIEVEIVSDTPAHVDSVISDFLANLLQAIVLVLLVAFALIGLRVSIIMATAIPLCIITSFGCMSLFHVYLEQCSIAALIIVLGMLVDNAVVISDNVLRWMEMGYPKKEAVWRGAQELVVPILTSTLTTVAAFLPMLTIPGETGEYIRSLPIIVSSALIVSFFIAMTITPLMCDIMLKDRSAQKLTEARTRSEQEKKTGRITAAGVLGIYGRFMFWSVKHKFLILGSVLAVFAGSLFIAARLGTAFFPKALRDQFVIEIELPAGSSPSQTTRVVEKVENILLSQSRTPKNGKMVERLKSAVTYVGKAGPRFFITVEQEPDKVYYAQMMVNTTSKWFTADLIRDIRPEIERIADARVVIKTLDMGPPVKTPVALRIRGKDTQELSRLAHEIEGCLEEVEGTSNVHNNWGNMSYQMAVSIDEEAANLAGVSNLEIASALYGYFSGFKVTTYREGRHQIDVVLRVKPEQRENLDYVALLYVEGQHGKVPLNAIAAIEPCWQVSLIQRYNLMRTIEVRSHVKSGYLGNNIIREVMPIIRERVRIPPGYILDLGGEYEETVKSQGSIGWALQISVVLIVFTLIIQFNSFVKPFVIILTMPLALIGAILGLWISGWPLGFMPLLGMVSLGGVVVNNAIILIDFIQNALAEGVPLRVAVIQSGQIRMRPILITTLTTVGGFVPLAISGGPLWEGLAYVMIFGLLVSTLLTLVVIPLVFLFITEHLRFLP